MALEPKLNNKTNTSPKQYQGPNVIKRIVRKVRVHSVCKRPYYPKSKCKDVTNDPFIVYCLGSKSGTSYGERHYLRLRRRVRSWVVRLVCLVRGFFFVYGEKKGEENKMSTV